MRISFCRRAKSLAQMRKLLPCPINEISSFEGPGLHGYHCPSDPDLVTSMLVTDVGDQMCW